MALYRHHYCAETGDPKPNEFEGSGDLTVKRAMVRAIGRYEDEDEYYYSLYFSLYISLHFSLYFSLCSVYVQCEVIALTPEFCHRNLSLLLSLSSLLQHPQRRRDVRPAHFRFPPRVVARE